MSEEIVKAIEDGAPKILAEFKRTRRPRYKGGVYERGGVWYIRFKFEGRDIRESSESRRKGDATDLLATRIREVRDGTYSQGAHSVTLADIKRAVLQDYTTQRRRSLDRAEGIFANLERILGAETPAPALARRLSSYATARLAEKVPTRAKAKPETDGKPDAKAPPVKTIATATINKELSLLRHGFKVAKVRQFWPTDYQELAEAGPRKGFPEPEEIERIIGHLPERLRPAVRFLSISGWRVREALRLEWRSVDLKAGTFRLESDETKGGEIRNYPYNEDPDLVTLIAAQRKLADQIEAVRRSRGDITPVSHVFCKPEDGSANIAYQYSWNRACKAAGHPGRLVHDLRRFAARELIRAGNTEAVCMAILGHRTPNIFRKYNITDERDIRQGVRNAAARRQSREA